MSVNILRSSYYYYPVQETLDEMDVTNAGQVAQWIRDNVHQSKWMIVNETMLMSGSALLGALQRFSDANGGNL